MRSSGSLRNFQSLCGCLAVRPHPPSVVRLRKCQTVGTNPCHVGKLECHGRGEGICTSDHLNPCYVQIFRKTSHVARTNYFPNTMPAGSISSRNILKCSSVGSGLIPTLPGMIISKLLFSFISAIVTPGFSEINVSLFVFSSKP